MATSGRWQFWVDRGGTFTDCIGVPPHGGALRVTKVLSGDDAPLEGIRQLMGLACDAPIPPCEVRMGTTLGTNALLERRGVATALVVTEGFADLLEIGDQTRPELFDLRIGRPPRLHAHVVETRARADHRGEVLTAVDDAALREALRRVLDDGAESLAVLVLNGHAAPALETRIAALGREVGFRHVAASHDVVNEIGMLARGDTAVVDAYLTPLLADYVRHLGQQLPGSDLAIMQSSGALTLAEHFRGRDSVLSGPAGGVVACGAIARACGLTQVIGFDMGGTSTDVCRWAGAPARIYETEIAGVRLRTPMMDIHTVAAGGGSLCAFDGHRLTVGPHSAGADPGPMCYGRPEAAALALTDINLVLGRIVDARFPIPLDVDRPRAALDALAIEVAEATGRAMDGLSLAAGFFEVAIESMAEAIRRVSVARGHDVRTHGLLVFGGAGGQHACAVASKLGVQKLVFHPLAGVLSAWGMGVADVGWHGERDVGRPTLDAAREPVADALSALVAEGRRRLTDDGFASEALQVRRRVALRYVGTETALTLELEASPASDRAAAAADDDAPPFDVESLAERFEAEHRREFGYARPGHAIEVALVRAEVNAPGHRAPVRLEAGDDVPTEFAPRTVWMAGELRHGVPTHARESLEPGEALSGPALVLEATGTIVIEPGWTATVRDDGILICETTTSAAAEARQATRERAHQSRREASADSPVDPVLLEVFNNRFMSIAEQMGTVLQRTAMSTNVRDRLDFSCAVFDAKGGLVANAPHIPVHLGAMSESVRAVAAAHPDPAPGDAFLTNDPAAGGSHLPDITVVSPVHDADGVLRFFVASRGHHADVGGIDPGSMPPFSTRLDQEGVVFRADAIVRGGELLRDEILDRLRAGDYPARDPEQNLADLEAQLAANRTGRRLLDGLVDEYGLDVVADYMGHVQDNARIQVEALLARLGDGSRSFRDALDDGTPIAVRVDIEGDRMVVDFEGTGPQLAGNLNAPRAVTVAAVLYVLRSMIREPIPLNGGCLVPVELRIPPGSLLDPSPTAAVAGGNVETAQRVVDVLLGALGACAASQGTMNNLTFGTERWGYYETIGGGSGAGDGFAGTSGVHTHMTNTRITDPEVLEARFPVRLRRFAFRPGSGGPGRWPGGEGLVREIEFLEPVQLSILSERRTRAPFGLAGGGPGSTGRNLLIDAQGTESELDSKASRTVDAHSRIRIETPGAGGYGPEEDASA